MSSVLTVTDATFEHEVEGHGGFPLWWGLTALVA